MQTNKNKFYNEVKSLLYIDALFSLEMFFAAVMVPFYLKVVGVTFEQMSYFLAFLLTANCILGIPAGVLADMVGRKQAYILGKLLYLLGLIGLLFVHQFWALLAVGMLFSLGVSLNGANLTALVYEIAQKENKSEDYFKTLAQTNSISLVSCAVASILTGFLSEIDLRLPLAIDIVLLGFTAALGWLLLKNYTDNQEQKQDASLLKKAQEFKELLVSGSKFAANNQTVLGMILVSAISFGILRVGFNFYQPILESHNISLSTFGFIVAGLNLIAAFFSQQMSRLTSNSISKFQFTALVGIAFVVAGILTFSFAGTAAFPLLAFTAHQIVRGTVDVFAKFTINQEIPANHKSRSTIFSFWVVTKPLCAAIASGFCGMLATQAGLLESFSMLSFLGGVLILMIPIQIFSVKSPQISSAKSQ